MHGSSYSEQSFESYSDQERALSGIQQEYHQIDDGPFRGRVISARLGPFRIFREQVSRGIIQTFQAGDAYVSAGLNMPWSSPAHMTDFSLAPGAGAYSCHAGEKRLVMEPGHDVAIVLTPIELLSIPRAASTAPIPAEDLAVWVAMLIEHIREGRNQALLSLAPDLLLDRLSIHVGAGAASEAARAPSDAVRVWKELSELLTCSDPTGLSVTALAARLGLSKATLRQACRESIDRNLDDLLVHVRLSRVRRALATGAAASVTEAALDHGFMHLSRFAKTYRQAFDELPSETLRSAKP